MSLTVSEAGNELVITLGEKFDFDSIDEFRTAYFGKPVKKVVVDFRRTEYMDSSGLGMLLNLRRQMGDEGADIVLSNCREQIKKILMISKFETKFTLR